MADIILKYLPDLQPATSAGDNDLLHLNSEGQDHSITVSSMMNVFLQFFFPVGSIHLRADSANPNTIFPGTKWSRLPASYNLRTGSDSGDNVMTTTGSDKVSIGVNNLPAHSHTVTGAAQSAGAHTHSLSGSTNATGDHYHSFNVNTNASGNHQHGNGIRNPGNYGGSGGYYGVRGISLGSGGWAQGGGQTGSESLTSADGNHAHNVSGNTNTTGNHAHSISGSAVSAGAHTHNVAGNTNSVGNGEQLTIVSASLFIAAWRRTA